MFLRILVFVTTFFSISHQANSFDWGFKQDKRDYIHIVGSSTISPLMASVSEEFSRGRALNGSPIQTPIVESSGSIAGFDFFCEGTGYKYPDFVNASRAISEDEVKKCYKNGVRHLIKISIGYDGIVIANDKGKNKLNLTKEQIFLALAEKIYDHQNKKLVKNPYKFWNQIDPKLPNQEIIFYGPPATSGTRDVFIDLIMEDYCMNQKEFIELFSNRIDLKKQCHNVRNDGVFIASGENDDNIVRSLKNNPAALGIFGFNFLVVNPQKIQPVKINGVLPDYNTISSKKYDLSRPLFVYFKKENIDLIPEMRDFIREIVNPETIGKNGYLVHSGLVPLSDKEIKELRKEILPKLK
jgi:phosphate transport system substrate-binding protein